MKIINRNSKLSDNFKEFDDERLIWFDNQYIQFQFKNNEPTFEVNEEGLKSLIEVLSRFSRTRNHTMLFLNNCNWGNGEFVNYTPFWYLDSPSDGLDFFKSIDKDNYLSFGFIKDDCNVYFEGTYKGFKKLISHFQYVLETKQDDSFIVDNSGNTNDENFKVNIRFVNKKGRVHSIRKK